MGKEAEETERERGGEETGLETEMWRRGREQGKVGLNTLENGAPGRT